MVVEDKSRCAFCGEKHEKVCYSCCESTTEDINEQIEGLQKQVTVLHDLINALMEANGLKRPPQIAAK